jgi:xylulose-5-phosphate/fructose-6-phosphate phosphoketolase
VTKHENTYPLGEFMRDIMKRNMQSFRVFGPDENTSNKLHAVYEVSEKCFWGDILPIDSDGTHLSRNGRVMEMLSEHTLEGWLEAYTLTGRHGLLSTYESFAHVIDSMVNQHCKWLDMMNREKWRRKVPSLNLLMTSTVWRQDHNGFTHQDPGFVDLVVNKKSSVTRIYFPADANTLLSMADHCFRSQNYVNVIVCDKQSHPQFVPIEKATQYCAEGVSIWDWASCEGEPDVVLAGCGDIVTFEVLSAVDILHRYTPELKVRLVNVIDLFRLSSEDTHGHGLTDDEFIRIFTADKPVVFNYHGYPYLIKRMIADRSNNLNFSVHGYVEKGSINTPLELAIQNGVDRFTLAIDALTQVATSKTQYINVINKLKQRRLVCQDYAYAHGVDLAEEANWKWPH